MYRDHLKVSLGVYSHRENFKNIFKHSPGLRPRVSTCLKYTETNKYRSHSPYTRTPFFGWSWKLLQVKMSTSLNKILKDSESLSPEELLELQIELLRRTQVIYLIISLF